MIGVVGEALVDVVIDSSGSRTAVPGGGPYNAARTVGRLGLECAFIGRLSTDAYGDLLRTGLLQSGVQLAVPQPIPLPTTLALARVDAEGSATYEFVVDDTSAPQLVPGDIAADLVAGLDSLHVGTLGLVWEPMATTVLGLLAGLPDRTLLFVDPNCRPDAVPDRQAHLRRIEETMARADVVKVSVEDLDYLRPGVDPVVAARSIVRQGSRIVLITDGGDEIHIVTPDHRTSLRPPRVVLADTIGAGDSLGGGFLAWWRHQKLGRPELDDHELVRAAVTTACEVAAITCSRVGADPPARSELTHAWTDP